MAVRQRHRVRFHTLALQAEKATASGADAARWALCLDIERDNLLSALAWCQQHGSVLSTRAGPRPPKAGVRASGRKPKQSV